MGRGNGGRRYYGCPSSCSLVLLLGMVGDSMRLKAFEANMNKSASWAKTAGGAIEFQARLLIRAGVSWGILDRF